MSTNEEMYNNGLNQQNMETDNRMWIGYQWYQFASDNNQSQTQECKDIKIHYISF